MDDWKNFPEGEEELSLTGEYPLFSEDNITEADDAWQDEDDAGGAPADFLYSPAVGGEDDFVIGKGFYLEEEPEEPSVRTQSRSASGKGKRKKRGRSGCLSSVIWVLAILLVAGGISFGVIMAGSDLLGIGKNDIVQVEIQKGASTESIAQTLKDAGAIKFPTLFRLYSKLKKYDGKYKYGVYEFNTEIGYSGIMHQLQTEGAQADMAEVRIPEMATIDQIMTLLEDAGVCSKENFKTAVQTAAFSESFVGDIPIEKVHYRLEGYLFPDTYKFIKDDSEKGAARAIQQMLKRMDEKFPQNWRRQAIDQGSNMHNILTMASIIEMEASSHPEEMANVAAVFYNRLQWNEAKLLGSSPTMKYPYGDGRYDTNKTEGLPPGPLCAPSEKAIEAALNPTEGFAATYFVTDSDMKFYYNSSLADHNRTIQDLKSKGKWLG